MITRFIRINHKCFRDFKWPRNLPHFKKINIIYGHNGSGKTTLSNIFRSIETKTCDTSCDIVIEEDNTSIDFFNVKSPIRVFNKEFISESILKQNSPISPIYYFGKDSVETKNNIDAISNLITNLNNQLSVVNSRIHDLTKHSEKLLEVGARAIKNKLTSSINKSYNNYNKSHYKSAIESILKGEIFAEELSEEDINLLTASKDTEKKSPLQTLLTLSVEDITRIVQQTTNLLNTTPTSITIRELASNTTSNNWVKDGLDIHKSQQLNTCLFCGEHLSSQRIATLNAHFDISYQTILDEADQLLSCIENFEKKFIQQPAKLSDTYPEITQRLTTTSKNISILNDEIKILTKDLRASISEKKKNPFATPSSPHLSDTITTHISAYDDYNTMVSEHNNISDNLKTKIDTALKKVELAFAMLDIPTFKELQENIITHENEKSPTSEQIKNRETQRNQLSQELTNNRIAAEELTKELSSFLGRSELSFELFNDGYQIKRNGDTADGLSEGEITAIALIYFTKTLYDDSGIAISESVVIIDDPATSQDSVFLYQIFGVIKSRCANAQQLFILTHNFTMFRLLKAWAQHQEKEHNGIYILSSTVNAGARTSSLRTLSKKLIKSKTEYHFLFKFVYDMSNPDGETSSEEDYYSASNIARRLLEAFLGFKYPSSNFKIRDAINNTDIAPEKKARIERFIQTYSHGMSTQTDAHDPCIISETPHVMRDILELIESTDSTHYRNMVQISQY